MEREQWKTIGLDELPSRDKVPALKIRVQAQLNRMNGGYCCVLAYVNVRSYWEVLWSLRKQFPIKMLPKIFHNGSNWNSTVAGIGPRGAFYKYIGELTATLGRELPLSAPGPELI